MGYAEKRGDYYIARFRAGPGRYPTVKGETGAAKRFRKKIDAERAADDEEATVRAGGWKDPAKGRMTFAAWANAWYAGLDLAPSTMQNYKRHLEEHLLPAFGEEALADIDEGMVNTWERDEREAGYRASSVKTWRSTLHVCLEDAVHPPASLIERNPAAKRRNRGKRAGRARHRGPEKPVVTTLEALLIAERAALLSGRDDEFILVVSKYFTGTRWGELIGLEVKYARLGSLRVERQLYELDTGELVDCPPKEDSYRDVDLPPFLSKLISDHIARTNPQPCPCHGLKFVFSGGHDGASASATKPVTMSAVAKHAGVAVGTVSNVLNHPEKVAEATRERVEKAIIELGFVRAVVAPARRKGAAHWRRSGFAAWVFTPAVSGFFPPKAPQPRRPVPVTGDPWPGAPVRGRNSQGRAEACWVPISPDLTPHLLRHSHRTLMDELRTPEKLKLERLGHEMGGVEGRYSHATPKMRAELMDDLTEEWVEALDARLAMSPGSPVAVLDALLEARRKEVLARAEGQRKVGRSEDRPTEFPRESVSVLRVKPRKGA